LYVFGPYVHTCEARMRRKEGRVSIVDVTRLFFLLVAPR
jgi:hypothetical protein